MRTHPHPAIEISGKLRTGFSLILLLAFGSAIYLIAARFDLLERFLAFSRAHEEWEVDELFIVGIALLFAIAFISIRQWRRLRQTRKELLHKNQSLVEAFAEIKQLRGIIPICSSCKKIRDEAGAWHQVEIYVREHTEAQFSHGLCPDCVSKMYSGPQLKFREPGLPGSASEK